MSTPAVTPNPRTLAQRVRAKFPGSYDDLDDYTLEQKVLAKYPQYSDLPQTPSPQEQQVASRPGVPRPSLYAPTGAPQSQVPWQQSRLGKQDNSDPDLARMNRNIYAADAASNPTPGDALAAGGALAAGTGVVRSLPFLANVARQHPTITALAAQEAVHQARQIPGVGRFIPAAAEWLPFLIPGLKGKGAEAAETEAPPPSTDQIPGRPYMPNQRFQRPEPQPVPQRTGPLLLEGEVQQPAPTPPELTTETRTLPGQVGPERIYGPRPKPAPPIPQRSGLQLSGEVQQAAPPPQPMSRTAVSQKLDQALPQALGAAEPLQPNVPLREQLPFTRSRVADTLPEGHTPVESSAMRSYRYDPQTREFQVMPKSGNAIAVYGDVSPEEAQSFADAESKGKAWQQIRQNPLVAKIVNGKRVAVKPAR